MPKDSGKSGGKLTPMMQQYQSMRRELPDDVLLFYRLGDFYELFFEDAQVASPLLNVALTKRNGMPMCGVPYHAAEGYLAKLIKAGKRVAIAEQTTEPQPGKIVEREIAQIISAGTIDDLNLLDSAKSNYLAAVYQQKGKIGFAYIEHTTGEFRVTEFTDRESFEDELTRLRPSELLFSEEQAADFDLLPNALDYDGYTFLLDQAEYTLKEHFKVQSLDGFGCSGLGPAIGAAGAIMHYVETQLRRSVSHLRTLKAYQTDQYVQIDASSQMNLDLVTSRSDGVKGSLLGAIDRTSTPMGARKLRNWVLHPIRDLETLTARQDLVEALIRESFLLSELRTSFSEVRDVERTISRLSQGSGNARDLKALEMSLRKVPDVREHLSALQGGALADELSLTLGDFTDLVDMLGLAICEEPPAPLKEGGIFADGYSDAIDELRKAASEGKQWVAELQNSEQDRTGIPSLKIKYNAVFGYFIEITKTHLDKVPPEYTRKQTMANAERFITPELKEVENKILGADERLRTLEYEEFLNLRETVLEHLKAIQTTAAALAEIDVMTSFAEVARLFDYARPVLNNTQNLVIEKGRHPVLDQNIGEEKFVPNDTGMSPDKNRFMLITGPNMAGKSTYIRQVALIVLLGQIGSFVPAESAEIGLVDRIFTRVGASDDLVKGQSTFMVEMTETALIANNATKQSLVILDEIGRGTATYDGLSIAWSVVEHLHDQVGCHTLFATHYHELTQLADSRAAVNNFNIAVREWNDQIIFLRQIVPGPADKSYGIQVARLAGLPDSIISRAKEILTGLEGENLPLEESPPSKKQAPRREPEEEGDDPQMMLFG
ncbi:DNA mismatch repair protein MutS [Verrucomicrobiales bacterium]|jgi:DNA mismatch repair protein MutS|nr:DNA mismatch repair protein MutS [Verrucomicrobiales bacterium]MDB3940787.1 DNA mismatch repair protein MutS [Verrucomicrobiales bacterium]